MIPKKKTLDKKIEKSKQKQSEGKVSVVEQKQNTDIPIKHFFKQNYLYAFATQAEVINFVKKIALKEETKRLPTILKNWRSLQKRVDDLSKAENGIADTIVSSPIPPQYATTIKSYSEDQLFQKTFSQFETDFALVEIDNLVAPQRAVNLDYVKKLTSSFPKKLSLSELLQICVSPTRQMDPIQHLEVAPNTHIFSSPNSDIRFLGSFVKEIQSEDLSYAELGGLPTAAIIAFVGYGTPPVNVLYDGKRMILNNGFHRVYALRKKGVTKIPVIVQHVKNVQLEFPQQVSGLPKEYLLQNPRPVLVKDFFVPDFTINLKIQERMKVVTVGVSVNQHDVPF